MYTIKTNSSLHAIASMFDDMGRKDNFSLHGIEAIMDYLEECSEDGSIDLDIIAICCDFTESSIEEYLNDYGLDGFEELVGDAYIIDPDDVVMYANENTWAILLDNGNILYLNY